MEPQAQRGTTLIETAVAVGIVATIAGAWLSVTIFASHAAGNDPLRDALQTTVQRELDVALDVFKYQGAALTPASIATSVPMPAGSPVPIVLSLTVSSLPTGAVHIDVAAVTQDASERAELAANLTARAPLPGSIVHAPGTAPAPTGAP